MPPVVIKAIVACLDCGPSFVDFGGKIAEVGFYLDEQKNDDIRWRHSDGYEAFVSQLPFQRVCSIWFKAKLDVTWSELDGLVRNGACERVPIQSSTTAPFWDFGSGMVLRLVVKQGSEETIGAVLFAAKG